ncbi:MAG: segregation/condensation protein A [Planctomycetota bacterium]
MTDYRVALDIYNGPLDLLLFLIRRDEIDIYDIPIARITQQYLQYVDLLNQLDPEIVSEFLVLAATLMEIKSRMLLPHPPQEQMDEEIVDPRLELVRQLLEYKTYKDAARSLEEAAAERALRHERRPTLPEGDTDEIPLENLDIWDLFEAFNRLLTQIGKTGGVHQVGVDDTPVALHAEDILDSIQRAGGTETFEEIFTGRSRAEMIGLFLALLELIRQRRIRAIQDRPFGPILIRLLDPTPLDRLDDVADEARDQSAMPSPFAHTAAPEVADESDGDDFLSALEGDDDGDLDPLSVPATVDGRSRRDAEIDSTEFVDDPK